MKQTDNYNLDLYEVDDVANLVDGYNRAMIKVDKVLKGIEDAYSDIKTDINALKTDINALKTDVDTTKTDINTLKTDVDKLKTEVVPIERGGTGATSAEKARELLNVPFANSKIEFIYNEAADPNKDPDAPYFHCVFGDSFYSVNLTKSYIDTNYGICRIEDRHN